MRNRVSAKTLQKRAEEGRGSGEGAEYQGLIGVRDFSSHGYSHRIWGYKSGRMHEFVSNGELACFYLMDWHDAVVDILDQVALAPEETQALATELGYEHPGVAGEGFVPMSTDLVAVFAEGAHPQRLAVAVKPWKKLASRRVLEKLEIERRYWARREVPWQIATEHEFPKVMIANLAHLYGYRSLERYDVPKEDREVAAVLAYLYDQLVATTGIAVEQVCRAADTRLHLPRGASITLAWHAVSTKKWRVDLSTPLKGHLPLPHLPSVE